VTRTSVTGVAGTSRDSPDMSARVFLSAPQSIGKHCAVTQSDPTRTLRTHFYGETPQTRRPWFPAWGRPGSFCGAGARHLAH
jgi:hypothetical protein